MHDISKESYIIIRLMSIGNMYILLFWTAKLQIDIIICSYMIGCWSCGRFLVVT